MLEEKLKKIKVECVEMCANAGAGHVSSALSCAEIVAVLYYEVMRIDSKNPEWGNRDRFVMSKNHASVVAYPILEDMGFFDDIDTKKFLVDGSVLGCHTKAGLKGVDFCGGSLGIGIGMAAGMAYGARLSGADWLTFCIVGDGECYEGSVWEAAMFAGANRLSNLVVIVDRNQMTVTDFTEKMLPLEPFADKWEAFGWEVREIQGHDLGQIRDSLSDVRMRSGGPLCIIANTKKGHGVDFIEDQMFWHGRAPVGEQAIDAIRQIQEGGGRLAQSN